MADPILNYADPTTPRRPRRLWLPAIILAVAIAVWYRGRLTPTFFPDMIDQWTLGALLVGGAFAVGACCTVPGWANSAFGALAVCLFLLENFEDNNFRGNTSFSDVALPWSLYVVLGAVLARVAAKLGSRVGK